ncbi:hypothetical protein D3C81_1804110 [compost metagenome]
MVATTRESAPKSSDIETITEAAPGATPQAAVLAGIPPKRTMARPTSALRHTVSIVAKSIIGQDWASEVSTARVMECAARIPTAPCPSLNAWRCTRMLAPHTPNPIATSIGPKNSPAGTCRNFNN